MKNGNRSYTDKQAADFQQPVMIHLISKVMRPDGPTEEMELYTDGVLYKKGAVFYLRYREEVKDIGPVDHTIKIQDGEGMILRKGPVAMRQPLKAGASTEGTYETPLGMMRTLTETDRCHVRWHEEQGCRHIDLGYHLYLQGQDVGRFHLNFQLKKAH